MCTPTGQRIAFVQSTWHETIVDRCRHSFADEIAELGVPRDHVRLLQGSRVVRTSAPRQTPRVDRAVRSRRCRWTCGRRGIYRHEFVAEAVINGLMSVQLDVGVPVISAVLTPHHFHEHEQHLAFFASHFELKGREAARACVGTMRSLAVL